MSTHTIADGTRIHYAIRGAGAPALILVHGWCSNLRHLAPQARHFARRHRVLSIDRRGHGAPTRPRTATRRPGTRRTSPRWRTRRACATRSSSDTPAAARPCSSSLVVTPGSCAAW